jgi:hypothetical protein
MSCPEVEEFFRVSDDKKFAGFAEGANTGGLSESEVDGRGRVRKIFGESNLGVAKIVFFDRLVKEIMPYCFDFFHIKYSIFRKISKVKMVGGAADERVKKWLRDNPKSEIRNPKKVVFVPGKLVSLVV